MKSHFNLFGIPVRIDPTFAFLALILGYLMYLSPGGPNGVTLFIAWIPIVTVAILLHELGHALVGRAFGLKSAIVLHGMGGLTQFDARAHRALSHGRRILITFAGPLVGIVVGAVALVVMFVAPLPSAVAGQALEAIVFTTLGWGILNLIPMMPLDGGQIVATILEKFFGRNGVRFALIGSLGLAVLLVGLIVFYWQALNGPWFTLFILGSLAYNNWRSYQLEKSLTTEAPFEPVLKRAYKALEAGNTAEVLQLGEAIRDAARTPGMLARASHLLAWAHLLDGDPEGARAALKTAPAGHRHDALLEGSVLLECGMHSEAIGPLIEALVDRADDSVSEALAKALSGAGRIDELIGLLESEERSQKAGLAALQRVAHQLFTSGHVKFAGTAYERIFARFGDAADAFNAACAQVRLGDHPRALRFLQRALEAGLDPETLDTDEDLAPLRGDPELDALRSAAPSPSA